MEPESYTLLLRVYQQCSNLSLLLIVDQDGKSLPIMPRLPEPPSKKKKQGVVESLFAEDEEIARDFYKHAKIVDVPSTSPADLGNILSNLAREFVRTMIEEVGKITEIVDPATTIKTKEMGEEWRRRYYSKYKLGSVFTRVSDRVLTHIV
jgi:hypothetical protein